METVILLYLINEDASWRVGLSTPTPTPNHPTHPLAYPYP